MSWPDDRFKRPPLQEIKTKSVSVASVDPGVEVKTNPGPSRGVSASGQVVALSLHDSEGSGQLTHDMNVSVLLRQILYELKWQRMYFQEMSGGRVRISPEELANDDR